jgi:hypothetical protein
MRVAAWVVGIATLVGAAVYTAVSLVRWEWNRAFFFALVFLAAEVALATALLLGRIEQTRASDTPPPNELDIVRRAAPSHVRFPWLAEHVARDRRDERAREAVNRSTVFVTLLVGGGVVLSGLAWVIDRIAASTTDRRRESELAAELADIAYPCGGLLVDADVALVHGTSTARAERARRLLGAAGRGGGGGDAAIGGGDGR